MAEGSNEDGRTLLFCPVGTQILDRIGSGVGPPTAGELCGINRLDADRGIDINFDCNQVPRQVGGIQMDQQLQHGEWKRN